MAGDANDPKPAGSRPLAEPSKPALSPEAQRRIGYHLQNLYEPVTSGSLNENLLGLLEQLGAEQPESPDEDGDNVLAGPWPDL